MKMTYQAPFSKVKNVESEEIIAGSLTLNGESGHATFHDEDATGAALTKDAAWDIWNEE